MIKRILLGLGGTQYTSVAIERAVKLAKQFEAEITGVTVVDFKRLAKIGLVPKGAFQNHFIKVINLLDFSDTYFMCGYDNKFAIKRGPETIEDLQQRVGNVV